MVRGSSPVIGGMGDGAADASAGGAAGGAQSVLQHLVDERPADRWADAALDGRGAADDGAGAHRWRQLPVYGAVSWRRAGARAEIAAGDADAYRLCVYRGRC